MTCENCQAEVETLVNRGGVYVCYICVLEYDLHQVGSKRKPEVVLLEKIRVLLDDLLHDRDAEINVHVINTVEVEGSVHTYESR